jgi:hypothetical protein
MRSEDNGAQQPERTGAESSGANSAGPEVVSDRTATTEETGGLGLKLALAGAAAAAALHTQPAAAECESGLIATGSAGDPGDCVGCSLSDCIDPSGDKLDRDPNDYTGDDPNCDSCDSCDTCDSCDSCESCDSCDGCDGCGDFGGCGS